MQNAKRSMIDHRRRRSPRRGPNPRRGYLYVAVLFTSLIVAGAVATAISLDTARIKTENAAVDRGSAIRMAESELHRVSVMLTQDATWRSTYQDSVVSDWTVYGSLVGANNAAARFVAIDHGGDGDLADDVFDDVRIVAHGRHGSAEAAVSVVLENGFAPLELLSYAVTTADDLEIENGASLVTESPIQVLDDCRTSSSGYVTTSTLECSGRIEMPVVGDVTSGAVETPTFSVVSRYESVGTEIPFNALPFYDGNRTIHSVVVSASTNPYGSVDENGIYWIDAQGQPLAIANSRIEATIAVRNANRVHLTGAISWQPAGREGAMLVSDSRIVFHDLEDVLDESALGANFNPPATPYRGSDSNVTLTDRYPTEFRGVVYSDRDVTIYPTVSGKPVVLTGAVICNDLNVFHDLFIRSLGELMTDVPYGFADPTQLRFKQGTFRRAETP